jgi:hypothetical protein
MRASILWLTIWTVKFLVVASPIAKQDSTLSLAHVRNPHFTIDLARSKEYIKARYERGGISRPTFVLTDIERPKKGATANSVSFDTGDMEYLFSVDIGGQEVNVNLDTGSSDLYFSLNLLIANKTLLRRFADGCSLLKQQKPTSAVRVFMIQR